MTPMLSLVVFDIAGTTVQDDGFVERAFLKVSDQYNLNLNAQWIKPRMGVHKLQVMREAIEQYKTDSKSDFDTLPEVLSQEFETAIENEIKDSTLLPMEGAIELITELQRCGVKVALTTGFSRRTALAVIQSAEIKVDALVASDEVSQGRPNPEIIKLAMHRTGINESQSIAVIGDTPSDLGSGTNANATLVVGIGHGTHKLHELAEHDHTHLVEDIQDLRSVLCEFVSGLTPLKSNSIS